MNKYDSYKDSGIEWIGEIPSHWEVKRLKRLAKICNGQDHKNVWDENGDYPIIGTGGVFGKANKYLHEGPSVILGRKGTIDKPQFIDTPFWSVDTAYYTEINQSVNPKLFYYLCTTINFELHKYGSAVPSMTQEVLSQIPFVIADSLEEQTAIATYLDRKTAEIDELIADKKRLLELYKEEKIAVINQAVTKGLNPKAPKKDSGIEWLGEIPEHWEVKKLKYVGKIRYGLGQPPKQKTDGLPIIRATNVFRGRIHDKDLVFVDPDDIPYDRDPILRTNDIIVVRSGAYTADSAIIPEKYDGAVTGYDMVFRCYVKYDPKFISYALLSDYILKRQLIMHSLRAAQPHLNREELGETIVVLPPIQEQQSIVNHIETECSRIDTQVERTKKLIELLTEYRTALISEVVTGKVKVA